MNDDEKRWRETLHRRETTLQPGLLARIATARVRALQAAQLPWWRLHAPALGGAVLATVLAVSVLLPVRQGWLQAPPDSRVSASQDTTFYDNLDFYLWLADSEMGTHD